jgi:anti-anti-sigma factor
MKITIKEEPLGAVMMVEGSMSQDDVQIFRVKLLELVEAGKKNFIIDMGAVPYISSLGLAVIVDIQNRLNASQGYIRMARLNPMLKNLFTITNLNRKIALYHDVEEALKA